MTGRVDQVDQARTDHVGVPFEDDGLRDGEQLRAWMTGRFREVLTGYPVVELTGPHDHRLATALAAVDVLAATLDHR